LAGLLGGTMNRVNAAPQDNGKTAQAQTAAPKPKDLPQNNIYYLRFD